MTQPLPTVSVVIPCYRYGRYLERCVECILQQQGVEVRILIIDDASPDDSATFAERIAARDSRVEFVRHEVNRGHIATYNEGLLDWAEGEYSVLISADDLLTDGALVRAVSVMQAHPRVGLVYGHAINWIDSRPMPVPRKRISNVRIWEGHEWVRKVCHLGHNVVTSPEVVVRTSMQRKVGRYRPELPHTGDLEMWLRFGAVCDIAFIEGADQAYYRIHGSNMTVERSPVVDLEQRRLAFDAFFATCGELFPDAPELRAKAQRQMAKEALWRACRAYDKRRMSNSPVASLEQFAFDTYGDSQHLPEYWGLRWRKRLGPKIPPYLQVFMVSAVHRKIRGILWKRRWRKKGY